MPDLFPSANTFEGHLIFSVLLFLVLFGLIAYLFAKRRVGHMIVGFLRTIGSFFYSPFAYLSRVVAELADYGERGDSDLRKSDQYLINKLLIACRAALIIFAIAGFAGAIVAGWEASLPPAPLRQAVDSTKTALDKNKEDMSIAVSRVQAYDSDWQNKRQSLIDQFRNERLQKSNSAQNENSQIESSARADGRMSQALDSIRGYLANNENASYAFQIQQAHDTAIQFLDRLGLSDSARVQLAKYVDNWQVIRLSKLQMDSMSEIQIRAQIQPDYDKLKRDADRLSAQVTYQERTLADLQSSIKYKPEAFFGGILLGALGFIVSVWIMGLIIELISAGIILVNDVRRIREDISERPPEQPRSVGATAGQ